MLTHHVKHFLDFFAQGKGKGSGVINTYCWMDAETSAPVKGRGCVHGKLKHISRWQKEIEREGVSVPTLHATLNETDLSGRKTQNIKAYRVLCCDLDRKISDDELLRIYKKYSVQMVVRSSQGKYHLYWQLERGSDLEVWRKLQLGIAHKLSGDLQVSLPTSMIRVPGFLRVNKDGKKERSSVMTFAQENPLRVLSIKNIVQMWPWIWKESERGEQELKKQRSAAAKIARELMKARGTEYDGLKFARMTPKIGRNTTLYLTVSEAVYVCEEKLSFEDALSFGAEINEAFAVPLDDTEARNAIRSAWKKGLRARKKQIRNRQDLVSKLAGSSAVEESGREESGQEDRQEQEEEKYQVTAEDLGQVLAEAIFGKQDFVADTFLDISRFIVDVLWRRKELGESERTKNQNILASAYKTKYYKRLTDFIIEALEHTGSFSVSGYGAFLLGKNDSGEPVKYRNSLNFDARSALLHDIFSGLYLEMVRSSLNGQGSGEGGSGDTGGSAGKGEKTDQEERRERREKQERNGGKKKEVNNLDYLKGNQ